MEVQRHGFDWESDIKRIVFGITKEAEDEFRLTYTAKWDIPIELNNGVNISIKTCGSDTVCMADPIRIFTQNPEHTNTCIVVFYKQTGNEKVLTRIVEWSLNDVPLLFGTVTLREIQELQDAIKLFPKNKNIKSDPVYRKKLDDMAAALNAKSGVMTFNRKIDSKKQRRLQCSISRFDEFITKHSHLVLYDTTEPILRNVRIRDRIVSGPRVFNQERDE